MDDVSWVVTQQDYECPWAMLGAGSTGHPCNFGSEKLGPVLVAWAPFRSGGSQPCLACLPADSSGTVSWLPAKLPPLLAGWHPGPSARGPAGGQQLECRRAVVSARRLKAGLGVGASSHPLWPSGTRHSCAGSQHHPQVGTSTELGRADSQKLQRKEHSGAVGPQNSAEPPAASISSSRKWSQSYLHGLSHRVRRLASIPECPPVQGLCWGQRMQHPVS